MYLIRKQFFKLCLKIRLILQLNKSLNFFRRKDLQYKMIRCTF